MIKIIHAGESVGEGWRVGTQLRASRRRPWMAGNIWDLEVSFLNSNLYMKETNVFIFPLVLFRRVVLFKSGKTCCSQSNLCQLKLQQCRLLNSIQSDPRQSCYTAVSQTELGSEVITSFDQRRLWGPFLLDQAFDTANYRVLINYLCHLYFSDVVLKWFQSPFNSQKENRR